MAAITAARGGTAENRERLVEGRGFCPHILIYLESRNTLSKHHLPSHVIFNNTALGILHWPIVNKMLRLRSLILISTTLVQSRPTSIIKRLQSRFTKDKSFILI